MARIAPRRVLLIRGMRGHPDEALKRVYRDAAGQAATLWEIGGAGHTGGLSAVPAEYERKVVGFFHQALLCRGPRDAAPVSGRAPGTAADGQGARRARARRR